MALTSIYWAFMNPLSLSLHIWLSFCPSLTPNPLVTLVTRLWIWRSTIHVLSSQAILALPHHLPLLSSWPSIHLPLAYNLNPSPLQNKKSLMQTYNVTLWSHRLPSNPYLKAIMSNWEPKRLSIFYYPLVLHWRSLNLLSIHPITHTSYSLRKLVGCLFYWISLSQHFLFLYIYVRLFLVCEC